MRQDFFDAARGLGAAVSTMPRCVGQFYAATSEVPAKIERPAKVVNAFVCIFIFFAFSPSGRLSERF